MDSAADRLSWSPPAPVPSRPQSQASRDERLGSRFAEQLAAKEGALGEKEGKDSRLLDSALARLGSGHERFGGGGGSAGEDSGEGAEAGVGAGSILELRGGAAVGGAGSVAGEPQALDLMVEKVAAAIAELRDKGAEQVVRIDFPPGTALAENALIARDAQTGAFSIRIVGLVPGVKEKRRAELENALRTGLEQRDIRATIAFDPGTPSSSTLRGLRRERA